MKLSKKIIVSTLSTTMALGFVAALSGTVAWYQFNTRVSTTIIGTNVADTGVLQISTDEVNWGRDLITKDLISPANPSDVQFTPVTFGKLNADGSLPAQAYMKPEASKNGEVGYLNAGKYGSVYEQATRNKEYIQYTVYIQALEAKSTGMERVAKDVYLSDITLDDNMGNTLIKGMRIHLSIDDGVETKNLLLAKQEVKDLALSGVLDVDGNQVADHVGGPEWADNRDNVVFYGNNGDRQDAEAIADWVVADRNDLNSLNANMAGKKLFTTSTSGSVEVTVTLWVEGWDTNIGTEDDVALTDLVYRKKTIKPVSEVAGLFLLNGSNYELAAGNAVDGKVYYNVYTEELELEAYGLVPANTYVQSGDNYVLVDSASEVADPAKHYFKLIAKQDMSIVYPADLTAALAGLYELNAGNYVLSADDADSFDANKEYFELLNEGATYAVKPLKDALDNDLPAGAVSVAGLFIKDANDNYIPASGMNASGVTYYELTDAGTVDSLPMWSGENTDGATFHFGLTFDVGHDAFVK